MQEGEGQILQAGGTSLQLPQLTLICVKGPLSFPGSDAQELSTLQSDPTGIGQGPLRANPAYNPLCRQPTAAQSQDP